MNTMREINTEAFAVKFRDTTMDLMKQFRNIGIQSWGIGGGISSKSETYELVTKNGDKVWRSVHTYIRASRDKNKCVENRTGIVATFPVKGISPLSTTLAAVIPYEYSRRYNTLAYHNDEHYEIRNYGRITSGRRGIKREDFFAYLIRIHPELIFMDEAKRPYIKIYEYWYNMTKEYFAQQTYDMVKLMEEIKSQYRG